MSIEYSRLTIPLTRETMANFNWKQTLRLVVMKTLGILLALILLPIALIFISYPLISFVTSHGGKEARIVTVSDHFGRIKTGSRVGGLFTLSTESKVAHQKSTSDSKIYCLYPAWPDELQPLKGDTLHVWPAKKPLVGAPLTEGWGWFIVGTIFVLGLVILEFAFLAFTVH